MRWPKFLHWHSWETTHVNRYYHATMQVCKCGTTREMVWKCKEGIGMPWENVEWLRSDGKRDKYSVLD